MANEIIIYGLIEGAALGGASRCVLQERNAEVIAQLPAEDEFPWLTRAMFALPGPWPQGTFRQQIIHFGLSMKDEFLSAKAVYDSERGWPAEERAAITGWIAKFENLLRKLYWYSAELHIQTEVEPDCLFRYVPTESAMGSIFQDEPRPIEDWHREVLSPAGVPSPRLRLTMQVFVAEACSGIDAESVRPLRDALRCFGAVFVKEPQSAEAFVLAWTETAAVASHVQALALDAWKLRECTGRPQLFWWPISSEPVPAGYQFYAEAAIPLPADAAAAARLICRSDEAAAPAEQPS